MEQQRFYVTTPIYYVNDEPHIGHSYTTILADIFTRYHKLLGHETRFLTGTDEHGLKVEQSAKKRNISPLAHCTEMSGRYQKLWSELEIGYDRFIRTTDADHEQLVTAMLQRLWDRGEIYAAEYEGLYYVSDEVFVTEAQAEKIKAEKPSAEIITIQEKNYFFRMSNHIDWLRQYIVDHPEFIQPDFRRNEVLGFLNQEGGVKDLCISRPKSRLEWGVELPFDRDYVCYVWVDALLNYVTGCQWGDKKGLEAWQEHPADLHLIGKDILTTHCVYWPTILHGLDLKLPKTIFAHGWWLLGGEKMSKSLGNVIKPLELANQVGGIDALRHLLTRGMILGQDATITEDRIKAIVNGELANDLGNLLSRSAKLLQQYFGGAVSDRQLVSSGESNEIRLEDHRVLFPSKYVESLDEGMDSIRQNLVRLFWNKDSEHIEVPYQTLLAETWKTVNLANKFFDEMKPWHYAKSDQPYVAEATLRKCWDVIAFVSLILSPVLPSKTATLRSAIGVHLDDLTLTDEMKLTTFKPGLTVNVTEPIFPRIDFDKVFAPDSKPEPIAKKEPKKVVVAEPEILREGIISIDDVKKVELRTAKVLTAKRVEGTTKLLRLQLDDGHGVDQPRQIIAGIAEHYAPDQLIGKNIVIVANLKPAKLKGILSSGMLLAAKIDGKLVLVTTDGDIATGASVG